MIPLTGPEIRRLLRAVGAPPAQFVFHLAWSSWRRHHQAVAQQGHVARRERRLRDISATPQASGPLPAPSVAPLPGMSAALTEDEWQRLLPLLPPEKPRRGRPALPHRPLLAAMLWVQRTGASWRQVPADAGPWQSVYNRYRRWRASGLWDRLTAALASSPAPAPSTVSPAT